MSNRTLDQADELAALKIAHELQIAALTEPGVSTNDRLSRFLAAIGKPDDLYLLWFTERAGTHHGARYFAWAKSVPGESVAHILWADTGGMEQSLFANLPGCQCPVIEVGWGRRRFPGIPRDIPIDWSPDRAALQAFARVQQEARYGAA